MLIVGNQPPPGEGLLLAHFGLNRREKEEKKRKKGPGVGGMFTGVPRPLSFYAKRCQKEEPPGGGFYDQYVYGALFHYVEGSWSVCD